MGGGLLPKGQNSALGGGHKATGHEVLLGRAAGRPLGELQPTLGSFSFEDEGAGLAWSVSVA